MGNGKKRKTPFFRPKHFILDDSNIEEFADKLHQDLPKLVAAVDAARENDMEVHITEYEDRYVVDLKKVL